MRSKRRTQCGGFSIIEAIIASIILAVAIGAMFSSWTTTYNSSNVTMQVTEAEEIDRAVLEIAKAYGPANLPTGTYSSSTQTGTWSGAYIPATGWTSGSTAYYSLNGTQVASSSAAGAYFSVTMTITDSPVLAGSGTTYSLEGATLRSIVVTCNSLTTSFSLSMATNLIQGGM
ncbi:MAG: hypothetical protein P4L46_05320 [Fimbriimonas sp.]|nr:hypothetical protein [Fimbriimonas sp.]